MYGTVACAILLIAISCRPARAQEAALLKDGDSAFAKGDYDAARRSFEQALQMAPQPPADSALRYDILKRLTSATAAAGQFADAQRFLQQAIGLRESAGDLLLSVNLNMRTKEFDHALATAQHIQAMHSKHTRRRAYRLRTIFFGSVKSISRKASQRSDESLLQA